MVVVPRVPWFGGDRMPLCSGSRAGLRGCGEKWRFSTENVPIHSRQHVSAVDGGSVSVYNWLKTSHSLPQFSKCSRRGLFAQLLQRFGG